MVQVGQSAVSRVSCCALATPDRATVDTATTASKSRAVVRSFITDPSDRCHGGDVGDHGEDPEVGPRLVGEVPDVALVRPALVAHGVDAPLLDLTPDRAVHALGGQADAEHAERADQEEHG